MKSNFSHRRAKVLIISFATAAFAVSAGFSAQLAARAAAYENTLANQYRHAFAELTVSVYEADVALQKLSYATAPALVTTLCGELFRSTASARMALSALPRDSLAPECAAPFVATGEDYALSLLKSTAAAGGCTAAQRKDLRALALTSSSLSQMLQDLQADLNRGTRGWTPRVSAPPQEAESLPTADTAAEFPELPSLVYDGPFSAHLAGGSPLLLAGQAQVTQEEACTIAAAFLEVKPEIFTPLPSGEGAVPTFAFSATVEGGEVYLEVTRKGGVVLELLGSRPVHHAQLATEDAVRAAQDFLSARGYENLAPSYSSCRENRLTINFAATQDDVICYSDLIKVTVALDTGRIVGFEAMGYLMNHGPRFLAAPGVSESAARAALSADLTPLSHQLALIPTAGGGEVLCHEFKCQAPDETHYLVYVNAETGQEEKLLILLEDESGTLVI